MVWEPIKFGAKVAVVCMLFVFGVQILFIKWGISEDFRQFLKSMQRPAPPVEDARLPQFRIGQTVNFFTPNYTVQVLNRQKTEHGWQYEVRNPREMTRLWVEEFELYPVEKTVYIEYKKNSPP